MAAVSQPNPLKSGRGWDDALARYVVRRRASYGTTRAAAETYRGEVEKPEIFISSPRAPQRQERA